MTNTHRHDYKFVGKLHEMMKKPYYQCNCGAVQVKGTVIEKRKSKFR